MKLRKKGNAAERRDERRESAPMGNGYTAPGSMNPHKGRGFAPKRMNAKQRSATVR